MRVLVDRDKCVGIPFPHFSSSISAPILRRARRSGVERFEFADEFA
jgi:hypothetical protein